MLKNVTIVSAHFSNFEWTRALITRLVEFTPADRLLEIILINQDRTKESRERLLQLHPLIEVVEYPRSERHFALAYHDHPVVVEKALQHAHGDLIILFDTDAHPFAPDWLIRVDQILTQYDAICATVEVDSDLTHPCFMVLQRNHVDLNLKFDLGLFDRGIDTGRLIGEQLTNAHQRVYLARPSPAFGGLWGKVYLECIYHNGQGTFGGSPSPKVRALDVWQQTWFRDVVLHKKRYRLTKLETVEFFARFLILTALPRLVSLNLTELGRSARRFINYVSRHVTLFAQSKTGQRR